MPTFPSTIHDARTALAAEELTSVELVEHSLKTIKAWEPKIHAFLEVLADEALAAAKQQDAKPGAGKLAGIPIAVKDMILTKDGHTAAAAKMLEKFRAPYEATVIKRLKDAGAIIIGKTNLDEFAMGSSTENSAFGPTKNPWDFSRVPGGTSGGSAAAVASGEVLAALGTDTGGSVRQPASFCGVVGVKPTYGRVSRFGVIAYGSSFDQVGPLTRSVKDAALLLEVLAGQDERDATSSPEPAGKYVQACGTNLRGIKVGIPKEYFGEGLSADVAKVVQEAIRHLESLGAAVQEISLPLTPAAIAAYYLLVKAEVSTNLARYDGWRWPAPAVETKSLIDHYMAVRGAGFGPEVKRGIVMGTYALSAGYVDAWYKQASKLRTLIRREYEEAFKQVDVIAGPVAPEAAFPIGSKTDDPLAMYLGDALTVPLSVAGVPALSVPCGFTKANLPIGLQLAAPHFEESCLFQVAHAYEQANEWHQMSPTK